VTNGRHKVIYVISQIDRIGHLAKESFIIRNFYSGDEYAPVIITYPPRLKPRTNRAMYDIVTRGVLVDHSTDDNIIWFCHRNRRNGSLTGIRQEGDTTYVLLPPERLIQKFARDYRDRRPTYFHSLSPEELERGLKTREAFNIPPEAPIVTLHVREGGYLPKLAYHSYRDSDIESYLPAIEYLIDRGFYVVRLGDSSMKRLHNPPPQLIDVPFHPSYNDFAEPYFLAVSSFFFGSSSGPAAAAQTFGTPVLYTNSQIQMRIWYGEQDMYLPKRYHSRQLGRDLTLEEIVLSPAHHFARIEDFERIGLELHENSPDEILVAVREMHGRISGAYGREREIDAVNRRVRMIRDKAQSCRHLLESDDRFYWPRLNFSLEFVRANPAYLGHNWHVDEA